MKISENENELASCCCDPTRVALIDKLRKNGLRPTKQRISLAEMLFSKGDRHISAEVLQKEAEASGISVSLATIYNSLHQFTNAGLLRAVPVDSSRTYFDTNVSNHHHFFFEDDNQVVDIPGDALGLSAMPEPPEGMEITKIEVVVRVRKKS